MRLHWRGCMHHDSEGSLQRSRRIRIEQTSGRRPRSTRTLRCAGHSSEGRAERGSQKRDLAGTPFPKAPVFPSSRICYGITGGPGCGRVVASAAADTAHVHACRVRPDGVGAVQARMADPTPCEIAPAGEPGNASLPSRAPGPISVVRTSETVPGAALRKRVPNARETQLLGVRLRIRDMSQRTGSRLDL